MSETAGQRLSGVRLSSGRFLSTAMGRPLDPDWVRHFAWYYRAELPQGHDLKIRQVPGVLYRSGEDIVLDNPMLFRNKTDDVANTAAAEYCRVKIEHAYKVMPDLGRAAARTLFARVESITLDNSKAFDDRRRIVARLATGSQEHSADMRVDEEIDQLRTIYPQRAQRTRGAVDRIGEFSVTLGKVFDPEMVLPTTVDVTSDVVMSRQVALLPLGVLNSRRMAE